MGKSLDGRNPNNSDFCFQDKKIDGSLDPNAKPKNICFKNNLYVRDGIWPSSIHIQDSDPKTGDPVFKNPGSLDPGDYVPSNAALVKGTGLPVKRLPGDKKGTYVGLNVKRDYLGNPVDMKKPGMGAIEI